MSFFKSFASLGFALVLPMLPAQAQTVPFTEAQKSALNEMIKEYLLKNPEVVQEALIELDRRQKEGEQSARLRITQDKTSPLFTAKHNVSFGNPAGDVTIVEFFDYNCGFCLGLTRLKPRRSPSPSNSSSHRTSCGASTKN